MAEAPAAATDSEPRAKIVNATWYPVPTNSLAHKRAASGGFTAAHNRLPLGTRVRVTRLENNKSVVVTITDRGITDRKIRLDLCKEAAEELGMVSEGIARVRMQILAGTPPGDTPALTDSTEKKM